MKPCAGSTWAAAAMLESLIRTSAISTASQKQAHARTRRQSLAGTVRFLSGVYKIVNNYLEAAAENVMFGGAPGSQIPADIEDSPQLPVQAPQLATRQT